MFCCGGALILRKGSELNMETKPFACHVTTNALLVTVLSLSLVLKYIFMNIYGLLVPLGRREKQYKKVL